MTDARGAAPPPPPPEREAEGRDAFTFEQPFDSSTVTVEQLVERMAESPGLAALPRLLAAEPAAEQDAILEREFDPADYERLILQLVTVEFNLGEKEKRAEEALRVALLKRRVAERLPADWDATKGVGLGRLRHVADAVADVGKRRADAGQLSEALALFHEAEDWYAQDEAERRRLGIERESEFDRLFHGRDVRAFLFDDIARCYQALGDAPRSREYAAKAAEADRLRPTSGSRFELLLGAGQAAEAAGDLDSALGAYVEALDLAVADQKSQVSTASVVTACHHIGQVLAAEGAVHRALRYHLRALELNTRSRMNDRMSHDHRAIGAILERRPDLGDALEHYEAALVCASAPADGSGRFVWHASDGSAYRVVEPELAWRASLALGKLRAQRGAYDGAHEALSLAVELTEAVRAATVEEEHRIGFQGGRIAAYDALIELLAGETPAGGEVRAAEAWHYAERARSRAFLDSLARSRLEPPASVPAELASREAALLDALEGLAARERWTLEDFQGLQDELEAVWREMVAAAPEASRYVELRHSDPIDVGEVAELLAGGAVLAEYVVLEERTLLLVLGAGRSEPRVIPIDVMLAELRECATERFAVERLRPFVEPLLDVTAEGDLICLAPHDVLHYLPLHAVEANGGPLIARNPVCYTPSASVLRYCRANLTGRREHALVLADPFGDLESAREEGSLVADLFRTRSYAGADATKATLLRELGANEVDVLHLACHGAFEPDRPLESALLLAPDARLTAAEIFRLDLDVDLVALSACESGVNQRRPGDELLGLTRALIHAGAPSVLVSLWRVDDLSTLVLMESFYLALARGLDKARALQRAQVDVMGMTDEQASAYVDERAAALRERGETERAERFERLAYRSLLAAEQRGGAGGSPFAHLSSWAPFVLVGEWR